MIHLNPELEQASIADALCIGAPTRVLSRANQAVVAINLLGSPQIRRGNELVTTFISDKARALFYYLVITHEPQSRSALATLCWADMAEAQALRNLRRALHNLQQLFAPHLAVNRQTIAFQPEPSHAVTVDLWQLLDGLAGNRHAQLAALARAPGTLLAGFTVADAPIFDEWLEGHRTHLQRTLIAVAQQLLHVPQLTPQQEVALLQQIVAHEPWQEAHQRRLFVWLARQGEHAEVLRRYAQLQAYLMAELAIEPEAATTLLVQRIEEAALRTADQLPQPPTASADRLHELAQIHHLLRPLPVNGVGRAPCRLITLTGPEDSGKSQLAVAVAHAERNRFLDGVWWVALDGLRDTEEVVGAVARTLALKLQGTTAVATQLIDAIRGRDLLLILDGGEALITPAFRTLILQLLEESPTLYLILTSRERLQLQQEQVITLRTPVAATR